MISTLTQAHKLSVRVIVNVVCALRDELGVNDWREAGL